mgnify:FL=1
MSVAEVGLSVGLSVTSHCRRIGSVFDPAVSGAHLTVSVPEPVPVPEPALSVEDLDRRLQRQGRDNWRQSRPHWTEAGWWDAALRPEVRALIQVPKGPALLTAVQEVGPVDGSRCPFPHLDPGHVADGAECAVGTPGNPCACQVIVTAAWATAAAWAADQADLSVLNSLGSTVQDPYLNPQCPHLGQIIDPSAEVVAPALRRSPQSVRNLIAKLRKRAAAGITMLSEAIRDGLLPAWQADFLLQDLDDLEPVGRDLVIDAVVTAMRTRHTNGWVSWTLSDLRRHAKRIKAGLHDELRKQRHRSESCDRVDKQLFGDGRGRLIAELPEDIVDRIHHRLTAIAHGLADDDPERGDSIDKLRADILTDLLLAPPDSSTPTTTPPGEVAVVINLSTVVRADHDPAHLPGVETVPAEVARELAADRKWRAWLTDATGTVVATSRTTYTPTAAVARVVRAREPHCRMPGCRRTRVDLDHVQPFPEGPTDPGNLASLCRRHHRLKTHHGWRLNDDSSTEFTWTDPNGVTITDHHDPPLPPSRSP